MQASVDHSLFFAESVRAVLECKSQWKIQEFEDVLAKCEAVHSIVTWTQPGTLEDRLSSIEYRLSALERGQDFAGTLFSRPNICTAAIFLTGGHTFTATSLSQDHLESADDQWPDLLLFLEPGRLVLKTYPPAEEPRNQGRISFFNFGVDALSVFTAALLERLTERAAQIEEPFPLYKYLPSSLDREPDESCDFDLTWPRFSRSPIYQTEDDRRYCQPPHDEADGDCEPG